MALAAIAVAATALFAVSAQAAPPMPTADVWMADGGEAKAVDTGPSYGDAVSFEHRIDGKIAKKYTLSMSVTCYQGNQTVYVWYGQPDFAFPLHDQTADGSAWDGGAATCRTNLQYSAHGRSATIGTYWFDVAAG
jgi:hypothetical protein